MKYVEYPNKRFMAKFDRFEPIIQDSTAMKELKKCDRRYFYRIVLGRAPKKEKYQANLDWGTIRHTFRELIETKGISEAMKGALSKKIAEPADKYEFLGDKVRLTKFLANEFDLWEKEKEQGKIKVVENSVEQAFSVQLPDGSLVGGRFDQLVLWSTQLWGRDFKTSSKDATWFASEKDPDDQATRYNYVLNKLHGQEIGGIIFDVVQNTKTVINKAYKHIVSKTKKQLEIWEGDQIHLNKQLALNRLEDTWPMREHNCQFCPFNWVCRQNNEAAMMAKLESDYSLRPWDFTNIDQSDI